MKSKQFALLAGAMLVLAVFISAAAASNWVEFQNDKENTGVTPDAGPDDATISELWTVPVGNGYVNTVSLALRDYVYVQGFTDLWKYNKTTGEFVDYVNVSAGSFQNACPASDGDNIIYVIDTGYSSGREPRISAIYADNMTPKYRYVIFEDDRLRQCSCPVTYYKDSNGTEFLFVGTVNMAAEDNVNLTDDGTYYCLYAENGTEVWHYDSNHDCGYYWAGAAVVGDYVVFGDDKANLTSVNIYDGSINNSITLPANNKEVRSSVTYVNLGGTHNLYVSNKDGRVYRATIDLNNNGALTYVERSSDMGISTSTPAHVNYANEDRLYVGYGNWQGGKVLCFNASDLSDVIWNTGNLDGGAFQCSPAVAYNGTGNPRMFVTCNGLGGYVYRITDMGETASNVRWRGSGYTYALPGVAISGDYAYFGNDNGRLYAIQ
jgi:outer membrane protein assembly factor BamB